MVDTPLIGPTLDEGDGGKKAAALLGALHPGCGTTAGRTTDLAAGGRP